MPVSSYAPEFLELFKSAAREECLIPVGDIKRAQHLRFRLNSLRRDMRKEQHSLTTIANSVQFTVTHKGDLRCSPADDQFLDVLKAAGISIGDNISYADGATEQRLPKPERAEAEEVIRKFLGIDKE